MKAQANVKPVTVNTAHVKATINTDVINERLDKAQFWLDSQIMTDCVPLMPLQTGTFIANTRARSAALAGSGYVCVAAPPMGRYLYYGRIMRDSETKKGPRRIPIAPGEYIFRWRRGAKLEPTDRYMKYSRPSAVPRWFETAKQNHMQDWTDGVQKILDGG